MACTDNSLKTVLVSSPIGEIEICGCEFGLHQVKQTDKDDSSFEPNERIKVELKVPYAIEDCKPVNDCFKWLKDYFNQKVASTCIPPLCPSIIQQGSFRDKALTLLPKSVPPGSTISYKQLAELSGNQKACRAAGQVMANNPVSLLIPCHRVISSKGLLGNYSHGKKNKIKDWLLKFEKDFPRGLLRKNGTLAA